MAKLRRWEIPVLILLAGGYWLVSIWAVTNKSMTQDEGIHLIAGYSYWTFNDYRLQPENGNLPQRLGGLVAALSGTRFVELDHPWWEQAAQFRLAPHVLYGLGNSGDWILFRARATMAVVAVLLVLGIWWWSRQIWGPWGGLVSAALAASSPNLLAHGPLVTSDVFFAAALFFLSFALWSVMQGITWRRLLCFYLLAGVLCLSKFSAVILLPMAAGFLGLRVFFGPEIPVEWGGRVVYRAKRRLERFLLLASLLMVGVIATYGTIWAGFGFRYEAFNEAPGQFPVELADFAEPDDPVYEILQFLQANRVFPQAYIHGFGDTYFKSRARAAYFLGENGNGGWRAFFPVSFLIKTPLATLLLVALLFLLAMSAWHHGGKQIGLGAFRSKAYQLAPLLIPAGLYGAMALGTNLNIGHRHLLPIYPFLFVLLGANRYWFTGLAGQRSRIMATAVAALLALNMASSARQYPHYISFFNLLVGGSENGRYYLVDSSLDWGQDLPLLGEWLAENEPEEPVYSMLFAAAPLDYYGIDTTVLFGYGGKNFTLNQPEIRPGYYAVSATILMGPYIDVFGPWNANREAEYERLNEKVHAIVDAVEHHVDLGLYFYRRPNVDWPTEFITFFHLRLHRLRLLLRQTEPEYTLANSIYIFHLDADELESGGLHDAAGFPPGLNLREGFQVYRRLQRLGPPDGGKLESP